MLHLDQINHWNKPTQYKKQIKQFLILFIYLCIYFLTFSYVFFFAILRNSSSLSYAIYPIKSEKEG